MALLCLGSLLLVVSGRCHAYILPSEQLIQFMAGNFSKFETVTIKQFTQPENLMEEEGMEVAEEIISMKSPNLFHSKIVNSKVGRTRKIDDRFRELLIANSEERLTALLSGMGINLKKVAFTRIEGTIAYRIGGEDPADPKILIEKERFLPLLLTYKPSAYYSEHAISVRFMDYRQVAEGWYPFEITYSYGAEVIERHIIHSLQANTPISPSLFDSPGVLSQPEVAGEEGESLSEDERLRRIIKTFEEKYGR
jgi:hypothetical protein